MITKEEVARLFETVLAVPSMNESVKIDLKITRTNALLLSNILERGLSKDNDDQSFNLLEIVSKENLLELRSFADECLKKANMTEFRDKLKLMIARK